MPSEFELIARHFARPTPGAVLGPGDDCAIVAPTPGFELCITTDMLAEGTHFLPGTDARRLGWKTLAVNLSDLAAMGARPRWVLLAGCLPEADEAWIGAFAQGFFELAKATEVDVIGGDTTRGPRNLCVTAIGEVAAGSALRRDGAQAGDDLWVSGRPGLAALGLAERQGRVVLPARVRKACLDALEQPLPRLALGRALVGVASAAIDVSDGLLGDLAHVLERSDLAARVETASLPALPGGVDPELARRAQLAGGDDYELVFAASPDRRRQIDEIAERTGVALTRFGACTPVAPRGPRFDLRAPDGSPLAFDSTGYDHFH
jgi:thiamine-monophosphate kinase